jgi:membrane-bound metal-dependent hydrolase YbcI (DUF457 family)
MLPDADLLLQTHRTVTHSLGATALVLIVAAVVTGWVTRVESRESGVGSRESRVESRGRFVIWCAVTCAVAHASHILLDWMGADYFEPAGIQALWPMSDRFFISGWDVFARIERRDPFALPVVVSNVKAVLQEIAIMAPFVWAAWRFRERSCNGAAVSRPTESGMSRADL